MTEAKSKALAPLLRAECINKMRELKKAKLAPEKSGAFLVSPQTSQGG
jgi:hypothetical protein